MTDRRVTTWASKQFIADVAKITDSAGWMDGGNVIVCLTPFQSELVSAITEFYLHWPKRWVSDAETGQPGDVSAEFIDSTLSDLQARLQMPVGCETDLTRIADTLEAMLDLQVASEASADARTICIDEVIDYLIVEENPLHAKWLFLLQAIRAIFAYVPEGNLCFSAAELIDIGTQVWRNLQIADGQNDTALIGSAQAAAQFGPTFSIFLANVLELVPGAEVADTFLGNFDETALSLVDTAITAVTGNYVTNKLDDIRNALNGGSILPGDNVVYQLKALKTEAALLRQLIAIKDSGVTGCECITIGPDDEEPTDEVETGVGDPPGDFPTWEEYDAQKCAYCNKLVDEIIEAFGLIKSLEQASIGLAFAAVVALIASVITGGATLFVLIASGLAIGTAGFVAYLALAEILITGLIYVDPLIAELEATKEEAVCDLYQATTTQAAKAVVVNWVVVAAQNIAPPQSFIDNCEKFADNITSDAMLNKLINSSPPLEYVGDVDCTVCSETPCDWIISPYFFTSQTITSAPAAYGSGTITTDGSTFTINSAPFTLNGVAHHGICLIVRGAQSYANAPSDLVTGQAVPDCDIDQWLQMQSGLPSGASVIAYVRNVSGNLVTTSFPGNNNTQNDYHVLRWHRSNAQGGAFSINARIISV